MLIDVLIYYITQMVHKNENQGKSNELNYIIVRLWRWTVSVLQFYFTYNLTTLPFLLRMLHNERQ